MPRIRSVHPDLFTDRNFMALSSDARILLIGIWCHAWDDGVFKWDDLELKARIMPCDNVEIIDLLAELERNNLINSYELDGRSYGVVRNFVRFQRPKKPNSSGFMRPEFRTYVGLNADGSVPVRNQFPTGTEKSSHRRGEEGRVDSPPEGKTYLVDSESGEVLDAE